MHHAEGHVVVKLVQVFTPSQQLLRPRGLLPINVLCAREIVQQFGVCAARKKKGATPDLSTSHPTLLFPEMGHGLRG